MFKCLISDTIHDSIFGMLKEIGCEYIYLPEITRDEIKKMINDFDGLIVRSKTFVDRDLLGENPRLKFVARAGAGIDNLDEEYLKEKGVVIIHAAEGNRDAVAEHTIGILLALLRNIPRSDSEVRNSIWKREENRGIELSGKTVSIIGYGNMGSAFAKRLVGFGCKVLAYDKYKTGFGSDLSEETNLEKIYKESDIVSLHIPLTLETKLMVDSSFLNQFSKEIILVNTARGEIVKLSDLAEAIRSRKVRGAALDVLENEKLDQMTSVQREAFNYLCQQTNVIFTPHIAGWTFESHIKINVALVDKIKAQVQSKIR